MKMRLTLRLFLFACSLLIASTTSAQWLTNGTSIYYNGGKVGIGTSAPSNALHVVDPVNQGVGIFQNPNGLIGLGIDGSGGYLQADGINFSFFAGTKRVLFGSSVTGKVGVGTTSPSGQLHAVAGPGVGTALYALTTTVGGTGVSGYVESAGFNSIGVVGIASDTGKGVVGYSNAGTGVVGSTNTGLAGKFEGNVQITGSLSKASGTFKIDHPLDPENKYLYHSFVESPDMMNIYNGSVVLDGSGSGLVTMPAYFEALNREFQYQLTCVGGYAQVYVASEISNNQFQIAGGKPGMKVSWLVMGVRRDPYAEKHRVQVEVEKEPEERGFYLHPEERGEPADRVIPSLRHDGPMAQKRARPNS